MPGSSVSASSALAAESGPRTLGKYELLRLLARGGMGEVHLARLPGELGFEKRLVIKTIRADLAADPRFVELFAAEAKTAVALSHPNIAPIYELGRADDGTLYTAMGWVDGPSLFVLGERLRALGRTLELGAALYITREILDGLAHAHSRDRERPPVVHRDVTPRNVLVDRSGRVQIVDFGIAKPAEAEVGTGMGSAGYMAPEQARGELVDPRADVFSVACVLYELLTNERAFGREGVWVLPSFADVPAQLHPVLERALALDARERFADAGEFLRVLAPILAEHAPAFGTRDLATILAELFDGEWQLEAGERSDERTPATLITGAIETFATRLEPAPASPEAPADEPAVATPVEQRRAFAWPLALVLIALVAGAGAIGYVLARTDERPEVAAPAPSEPTPGDDAKPEPEPEQGPELRPSPIPEPAQTDPGPPPRVELRVSPEDATVELDGVRLDGPPYALALADAPVSLSIRHPDHRPHELAIDPRDPPRGPIDVKLEPLELGSLTVLAPSVSWAEVWLDGTKLGTTPLTDKPVLEGRHKLEVRCPAAVCGSARVLLEQSIRVRPGRELELSAPGS